MVATHSVGLFLVGYWIVNPYDVILTIKSWVTHNNSPLLVSLVSLQWRMSRYQGALPAGVSLDDFSKSLIGVLVNC